MQRLFSTFPNAWPGCGLLLLRLSCGAPPLVIGSTTLWAAQVDAAFGIELFSGATALSMLVGFWTPLAAASQAVLQGFSHSPAKRSSGHTGRWQSRISAW